jgi:glycosyltransferase involved in cell wall biosynthesis
MTRVALNAHLLSGKLGYRTAGIHGYIYNLLAHLPAVMPPDWSLTAFAGRANPHNFDGLSLRRASLDTESPLKRILWEQAAQPAAIRGFDLYHGLAFVTPLLNPAPAVVTVYDLSFLHYPQVLTAARRLYLRLFTAHSCRRARRVIAISHSTARDVHESLGIAVDRIDVAPCGYDAARFVPLDAAEVDAFRIREGLPERFWYFVGTLEPRKNLTTLLEAYAGLPPDERLPLIVGGGRGWLYDDIFAAHERLGLQDSVRFTGFVPADDLPLWYNAAEAFVYPSIYEGFGLSVLEAMACGTPVIISDASSLPEVAGDAGLKVPPQDVDAWRAALRRAARDSAWRAESHHRGLLQARRYNWRMTAQETLKSYQRALHDT